MPELPEDIVNDLRLQGNIHPDRIALASGQDFPEVDSNFSVDSLKADIDTNIRPTLYQVQLTGAHPRTSDEGIASIINKLSEPFFARKLSRLCEEVTWPGRTYSTQPIVYGNAPASKIPYTSTYTGTFDTVFQLDKNAYMMNKLIQWNDMVMNHKQNLMNYYNNIICPEMILTQMDVHGRSVFGVRVQNCWPETIRERAYGQNLSNQLTKFVVTWSFQRAEFFNSNGPSPDELESIFGGRPSFGRGAGQYDRFGSSIGG